MKSSLTVTALFMCLCCFLSNYAFAADTAKSETTKKVTKVVDKKSTNMQKVNINNASVAELQKLKGIGQAKAKAIVDYRTKNGKFTDLQQLTMVSGIGDKLVNQNRGHMSF
ncbi:ComEA family DNA-binding protein [Shewanella sp. A14]